MIRRGKCLPVCQEERQERDSLNFVQLIILVHRSIHCLGYIQHHYVSNFLINYAHS